MKTHNFVHYSLLMLCSVAALSVKAQPTVANFSIVAPRIVENETPFKIVVMEIDEVGRPIVPGVAGPVSLKAFITNSSGDADSVSIAPSSFQASGSGLDEVEITLGSLNSGTEIFIQAHGNGLPHFDGNASSTQVLDSASFGNSTTGVEISVPYMANPNVPFPIFLTPVERVENQIGHPTSFNHQIRLRADTGSITPKIVDINVVAGGSHLAYVTLDGVNSNIKITVASTDSLEVREFKVTFTVKDQAFLTNPYTVINPYYHVIDSLSLQGPTLNVTAGSEWESRIWPIHSESDETKRGWNLVAKIGEAGVGGSDIHLHYLMIPQTVPSDSLPGLSTLWSALTIHTDAQGWEPTQNSAAFPDSFSGDYWVRAQFLTDGTFPALNTEFNADFNEFDTVLQLIEDNGEVVDFNEDNGDGQNGDNGNVQQDSTLADFHVKGSRWTTRMFEAVRPDQGHVFHMIADFQIPFVDDGQDTTGAKYKPVSLLLSFVPTNSGAPTIPDSVWNAGFVVGPEDFSNITGDALDSDFSGSYYARLSVLGGPNGDDQGDLGRSNQINTTGVPVFSTTIALYPGHGKPGKTVTNKVVLLQNQDAQPAAGLQFDVATDPGATFQGVVSHLSGFSISFAPPDSSGVRFLIFSVGGNSIPGGNTTLMQLVYQVDDTVSLGRRISLTLSESVISNHSSGPIPHNTVDSHIDVGIKGDLANNDGVIDVTDIVFLINIILRNVPVPDAGTFEHFLADLNSDGSINIIDVVRAVNIVIGNAVSKQIAASTGPAVLHLSDLKSGDEGRLMLPIKSQFAGFVAGLELILKYDPAMIRIGDVQPTARLDGMTVEQSVSEGMIHIIIYSVDGRTFQSPALNTLLNIPVEFLGNDGGSISVEQAIIADPQAQGVTLSITNGSVKVSKTPTSFTLGLNAPNPFNPSTRISYDVPQTSRIRLTIYNLLGQEVVVLVDGVQAVGRYTVDWHGANTQGHSVASGVYLYRLTSETGFTETRRMTLLK